MVILIAEYIWIDADGFPRSKARTLEVTSEYDNLQRYLSELPLWNFDGSSTGQADINDSEVILKPQKVYKDPFRNFRDCITILVLCDCYDRNMNPIKTNTREPAKEIFDKVEKEKPWFGFEQEYVLYDTKTRKPLGWINGKEPEPQGPYYCGIGGDRAFGRYIVDLHYELCLDIGLNISGINGEVMPGQWEFQIGPVEGIDAGDQMCIARYLLLGIAEEKNVSVCFDSKPEKGDWNGSGFHTNFSTTRMRNIGGLTEIYNAIKKLSKKHKEHLAVYGNNTHRLTGSYETSDPNIFTFGVSDRSASVRIPLQTERDGYGYLEDRRPSSDCDPYVVSSIIAETTIL